VSKEIKKINPNADIRGNESNPRTGAFEITIDNKLAYSKFKTHNFPSNEEIKSLLND
tara:strand:- start:2 stop:172 length:171 start_codon:yes stop_codon:yes gene_type:complete